MEIVKLAADDWQAYRDLRLRALKEDAGAFGSTYAESAILPEGRWRSRLLDAQKGERSWLFFAREGGKLVGMIGAFIDDGSPGTATIVSVYVPAEERGKGTSSRLMERVLRELSTNASLKLATLAVNKRQLPAIGLYRKFGFQCSGIETAQMGDGTVAEELVMMRPLPY